MASQESRLIISIDARNAERTARELNRELQNITNGGNQADRRVNQLGSSLRSLATYMAGVVTVGAAINKIDAYTNLQNRLKLVTSSQQELNQATTDTFSIAQRTASSWESVAMVYQRFADNADRLNITMKQTAALTETVSKAISISGGRAASADAALVQFGQALASGVLRGEEFNSIAEQAPGLLKAIAFGLDTNVGSLRAMAAEGKITSDVLVDALSKAQPYIDELFNKTDFTIGQEFTRLSNEITKFVGEAGKGTGAASALGGAVGLLAQNLSTIADIAVVGGLALLTKTILTQTVAVYGSIQEVLRRRAANLALLESNVKLAGLEVSRTRQVVALTASEVNLARIEYNSAVTRTERAAATIRLTQAEVALALAEKQKTAASIADTAAQNANNAARTRGAALLGLIGGPIGAITLGVAALAAGYVYLKNQTAEANAKLEEQGKIALETDENLKKLSGNDKKSAVKDLTAAFDDQNKKLKESKDSTDAALYAIRAVSVENEKARKITEDARKGIISYNEAIKLLNNENVPTELRDELKKQALQYDENSAKASRSKEVLKIFGVEVTLTGNAAQDAAVKHNAQSAAIDGVGASAVKAAKDLQDYQLKLNQGNLTNRYESAYIEQGYSPAQSKALVEAQKAVGLDSGILSEQQIANALKSVEIAENRNKLEDSYNDKVKKGIKDQKDAAKEAEAARKKAQKDAEDLAKRQGESRVAIAYSYLNDLEKLEEDYQKDIQAIRDANFGADQKKFEDRAKARYEFNQEMYLIQITDEINAFKDSENQKLDRRKRSQLEAVQSSGKYNEDIKKLKIAAINEEYLLDKAAIQLRRQERSFQASEQFMSETAAINERYRLERANILLINDEHERAHLLELNRLKQQTEQVQRTQDAQDAVDKIKSDRSGTGQFDAIYSQQAEANNASQELLDAKIAEGYENQEQLQKEHLDRMAENARIANQALISLEFSRAQEVLGSSADLFKTLLGEQSKGYKAIYAVQKAFAIAEILLNAPKSYSKAFDAVVGIPFIGPALAPIAGGVAIATQLAQVASIKSMNPTGFQSGGYTGGGGVSDVAGVVHGQEYVLNAQATKRVGVDTLNAINSGSDLKSTSPVNIIINPPTGYEAVTKKDGDNVTIDIVKKMISESFDSLNNPNSKPSRAMQSAFALQPNRNN